MNFKKIILIMLITLIFASILFGSLGNFFFEVFGIVNEVENEFGGNSNGLIDSFNSNSNNYDNHRVDYETGMYDSEGNPIILSEISSNGSDLDPGVYMVYWSKLGVINQTRIE